MPVFWPSNRTSSLSRDPDGQQSSGYHTLQDPDADKPILTARVRWSRFGGFNSHRNHFSFTALGWFSVGAGAELVSTRSRPVSWPRGSRIVTGPVGIALIMISLTTCFAPRV